MLHLTRDLFNKKKIFSGEQKQKKQILFSGIIFHAKKKNKKLHSKLKYNDFQLIMGQLLKYLVLPSTIHEGVHKPILILSSTYGLPGSGEILVTC